jgi:hypothetical protein
MSLATRGGSVLYSRAMKPSFRSDQDRDADSHQFSQGRNRGLGQPPLLHERSNYGQESAIGWGPLFGSGPRFGGEEKKGSKASRTGPGQGGRAASPGFSTNDRMRVLLGCQGGWAGMLVLEFGNWGFEGLAGRTKNRSLDLSSIQYSRRARLVEWSRMSNGKTVMGGASATWASSR